MPANCARKCDLKHHEMRRARSGLGGCGHRMHQRRTGGTGSGVWKSRCAKPATSRVVAALTSGVLRRFDLLAALATQDAENPRTVCACQPVVSIISARVALFARFIIA